MEGDCNVYAHSSLWMRPTSEWSINAKMVLNRTAECFGKIPPFVTLLPPSTAPQNDPRYLINRKYERFGKISFLLPYSLPPAPQEWHLLSHISNIKKKKKKKNPTWNNHSEPLRIILFRNISERCAFVILLPPCSPQKWWLFWNISERYTFVTLLQPPPHCTPKLTLAIL